LNDRLGHVRAFHCNFANIAPKVGIDRPSNDRVTSAAIANPDRNAVSTCAVPHQSPPNTSGNGDRVLRQSRSNG
jgi:hypothetical protein